MIRTLAGCILDVAMGHEACKAKSDPTQLLAVLIRKKCVAVLTATRQEDPTSTANHEGHGLTL